MQIHRAAPGEASASMSAPNAPQGPTAGFEAAAGELAAASTALSAGVSSGSGGAFAWRATTRHVLARVGPVRGIPAPLSVLTPVPAAIVFSAIAFSAAAAASAASLRKSSFLDASEHFSVPIRFFIPRKGQIRDCAFAGTPDAVASAVAAASDAALSAGATAAAAAVAATAVVVLFVAAAVATAAAVVAAAAILVLLLHLINPSLEHWFVVKDERIHGMLTIPRFCRHTTVDH